MLELCFYLIGFVGFFTLSHFMLSAFEIAQEQTMLSRTQAFIELGNFSSYSNAAQNDSKSDDKKSQVLFTLGKKSSGVEVDLKKNEDFIKAVQGELLIDVRNPTKPENYWQNFRFPRGKTTLMWAGASGFQFDALLKLNLTSVVGIAHNRSIALDASSVSTTPSDSEKTGLYSGGLTLDTFAVLSNGEMQLGHGLEDNVETLKRHLRRAVKNDSSLSDEAAKLEKHLDLSGAITGGAVASSVQVAMSLAMQAGLQTLQGLAKDSGMFPQPANAASASGAQANSAETAAASEGSAAGKALQQFGTNLTQQLTAPFQGAQSFANGDYISGPLNTVISPFKEAAVGYNELTSGKLYVPLSTTGAASLQNSSAGMIAQLDGLSKIVSFAQFGSSFAGSQASSFAPALSEVSGALSLPKQIIGIQQAWVDVNTSGIGNVFDAISKTAAPVTMIAAAVAPAAGVPLGMFNQVLAIASAGAHGLSDIASFDTATQAAQKLEEIGKLTANVGQMYAGVATLAKKDPSIGSYLSMAGAAIASVGHIGETMAALKNLKADINIGSVGADLLKTQFTKGLNVINDFGNQLSQLGTNTQQALSSLLGPDKALVDANASNTVGNIRDLRNKMVVGGIVLFDPLSDSTSKSNLDLANASLQDMSKSLIGNMTFHGDNAQLITTTRADFGLVQQALDNMSAYKAGTADLDAELLVAAEHASGELKDILATHFSSDEFSQAQIQAMTGSFGNTNQQKMEAQAIASHMTYQSTKAMEQDFAAQHPFASFIQMFSGSNRTSSTFSLNLERARVLAKTTIESASKHQQAAEIAQVASEITADGPVTSSNSYATKTTVTHAAQILQDELNTNRSLSDSTRAFYQIQVQKLQGIASRIVTPLQTLQLSNRQAEVYINDVKNRLPSGLLPQSWGLFN